MHGYATQAMGNQCGATPSDPYHVNLCLLSCNAPIHRKKRIRELVEGAGHIVLFLPTYSPDFNAIEHDFSALKRLWMYAPPGTTIDEIIRNYCTT